MKIKEIRIYAECLEQGLDFKDYFLEINKELKIYNIYLSKAKGKTLYSDSKLSKILKLKNFDLVISIISDNNNEIPILLIEYSTAVPTDDHKMQRSDVYFWSGSFKIPTMKISPFSKFSSSKHGGGGKLSTNSEQILALYNNSLVYFIDFRVDNNNNLIINKQRPSCIAKNSKIATILRNILNVYTESSNENVAYNKLLKSQKESVGNYNIQALKDLFPNSDRFTRSKEGDNIIVKINRFGHAMDPDRGILFFMNMLFGIDNTITKIIIMRNNEVSYKSLFDGLPSQRLLDISQKMKNKFTSGIAKEIFQIATGIDLEFKQITTDLYWIQDDDFKHFLQTYTSNVYKSIFINSKALILCDYNNNILCKILWNTNIAKQYREAISLNHNYTPLPIESLGSKNINEDIITFASAKIFEKLGCEILAISYPGAQGDKAILIGSGRNTKRIYIDIIASKKDNKFYVFLHENKDKAGKINSDVDKLNNIKTNYQENLNIFLNKMGKKMFNEIILGIGYETCNNPTNQHLGNIDYIFTFNLHSQETCTNIDFTIGIINLNLIDFFSPLADDKKRLQGRMSIDKIYRVTKI